MMVVPVRVTVSILMPVIFCVFVILIMVVRHFENRLESNLFL